MNGRTAKLLRKTSGGDRGRYRMVKTAFTRSPKHIRAQGKQMAKDLIEVERQHDELAKMNLNPPIKVD